MTIAISAAQTNEVLTSDTQEKHISIAAILIALVQFLQDMEIKVLNNNSQNVKNQCHMQDTVTKYNSELARKQCDELEKQSQIYIQQKKHELVLNIFKWLLFGVSSVFSFAFFGIGTAVMLTTINVLSSSGLLDKMCKAIDKATGSKALSGILKLGIIGASSLGVAMASKGLDIAVKAGVKTIGKTSAKAAKDFAKDLAESRLLNQSGYWSTAFMSGGTLLLSLNPIQDFFSAGSSNTKVQSGEEEELSIVAMIINTILSLGMCALGGSRTTDISIPKLHLKLEGELPAITSTALLSFIISAGVLQALIQVPQGSYSALASLTLKKSAELSEKQASTQAEQTLIDTVLQMGESSYEEVQSFTKSSASDLDKVKDIIPFVSMSEETVARLLA